jgi:hypothetical protein
MTVMTGGAHCASARLAVTRAGWHRAAEHILAAAVHRAAGKIGLIPSTGGLRTPSFGTDARFLAVDGAAGTKRTPLITVRGAAEFAAVTPGAPAGVCEPATTLDLDAPLMIEPDAARLLAEWHGLGTQALGRFAAETPGGKPAGPVLRPEHFDAGMTAAAINYGASPGDDHITDPYLYAGPHDGPPPGDPAFWNAPFGAVRIFARVGTVAEAAAFVGDGRERVLAHAATTPHREDIMKGLQDKVALVTGGSSGTGQAIAISLGEEGANVAINYAGRPEGAKTRRLAMTRLNVTDARCEALFASELQRSDTPNADMVAEVISHTVRQLGTRGCANRMAQEFGDHPEMAADRMRWVRQLVGEVSAPAIAWRASRGGRPPAAPGAPP